MGLLKKYLQRNGSNKLSSYHVFKITLKDSLNIDDFITYYN